MTTIKEDEARGYACGTNWRLYLGDFRDTLRDVTCDLLCADPPYSPKTHAGQRTGSSIEESTIGYDAWTQRDADDLAAFFVERCRWWSVIFSDDVLRPAHESAWSSRGWYTFGPVAWVRTNPAPRMQGDGPTSAFDHLSVAAREEVGPTSALDEINVARPTPAGADGFAAGVLHGERSRLDRRAPRAARTSPRCARSSATTRSPATWCATRRPEVARGYSRRSSRVALPSVPSATLQRGERRLRGSSAATPRASISGELRPVAQTAPFAV